MNNFITKNILKLSNCLACNSGKLELLLDLNNQPLANSYTKSKEEIQEEYPLAINKCNNCYHIQLTYAVNPNLMFKNYLYVSGTSQTMLEHFKWFADYSIEYYSLLYNMQPLTVLDIGCNDGSQLNFYKARSLETTGVDPAENLKSVSSSKSHNIYTGYFDENFLANNNTFFNIIVAQNVFAHNYNPLKFLTNIKSIMSDTSLIFIQTSQADMILNNEFDTIYHEHISFYNSNSMNELCKRAGLNLIDVVKCPLHGNSYIFVMSKNINRSANIYNILEMERKAGLLNNKIYIEYSNKCTEVALKFRNTVNDLKKEGYKVVGYGAAAKGMTFLNYTKTTMDLIIDDNPLKHYHYTPGSRVKIVPIDALNSYSEQDKLLFVPLAWNFFTEIQKKILSIRHNQNDKFLKYFPNVLVE